jgi:hypothetical protein
LIEQAQVQRLPLFLAALWWGGISALSFLAVPVLFARLGAPVAGPVAAQFFSLQCWASIFIGMAMLVLLKRQGSTKGLVDDTGGGSMQGPALNTMAIVLLAMLLAMVQEFGVAQKIVTARATGGNLRLWHAVGSAMVLGQWACAGAVLWRSASALHPKG